jgi:hypothetical protein
MKGRWILPVVMAVAAMTQASCSRQAATTSRQAETTPPGMGYGPVTEGDVVNLRRPDSDFEWTFTKTEFVLKKSKGAIPADLTDKLLPGGTTADEIRGKWQLIRQDGQRLVLTEIKAGDKPGNKEVSLKIYRTAPYIIRIGEPEQYVFSVGR